MKKIKIKAWNKISKTMSDWDSSKVYDLFNNSNWILRLFIGIIDKNGKEIYSGDVVKFKLFGEYYTAKIKYDERHAMFLFLTDKAALTMFDMWDYRLEEYPQFEIIGNIYENPELINNER